MESMFTTATDVDNKELKVEVTPPKKKLFGGMRDNNSIKLDEPPKELVIPAKRRGRPRKVKPLNGEDGEVRQEKAAILTTNVPIAEMYDETNDMLRETVSQLGVLQDELKTEFNQLRMSSRLKGKYQYMTDMASVISTITSTKLSAIKAINDNITTAAKLELSRVKDLKIDAGDDNAAIMGLYKNLLDAPRQQLESTGFVPPQAIQGMDFPSFIAQRAQSFDLIPPSDRTQLSPSQEFTPEQNRMIMESNPNTKVVVVYDRRTDAKYFKMMNLATKQYVENVSLPDDFLLEAMRINFATGTARNSNTNMDFPLVVIGNDGRIEEAPLISQARNGSSTSFDDGF